MAAQTEGSSESHSPEIVGNAFVEQYYQILHRSPELAHNFYQDSSVLSRPGKDGEMSSVTTMQGINEKIISFDYKNYTLEIFTIDSQMSYMDGVLVMVTGCLYGRDDLPQNFTQSFFLAPQKKGYFVLNDILRYMDEHNSVPADSNEINGVENSQTTPLTPDPEPTHIADQTELDHNTSILEKDNDDNDKDVDQVFSLPLDNGDESVIDKTVVADVILSSSQNDVQPVIETSSDITVDAPKKSYASVVTAPCLVKVSPAKPANPAKKPTVVAAQAPVAPKATAPTRNPSIERNNDKTVKGHSIHIRNLPFDATPEQLEGIFKKFGPIKQDGIQVRGFKHQASCFGFVEFESSSSMEDALKASFIYIGNRKAYIEEKRRDSNDGGRFLAGRSGAWNRENFGGGRGYRRNQVEKGAAFSGHNQATNGCGREVHQNGIAHKSAPNGHVREVRQNGEAHPSADMA